MINYLKPNLVVIGVPPLEQENFRIFIKKKNRFFM